MTDSVRLGSRFEWCLDVQGTWDRHEEGLRAALARVAEYNEAAVVLSSTVDELDRAEAIERLDSLERRARDAIDAYNAVAWLDARASTEAALIDEVRQLNDGTEGTKGVAYARAFEAFQGVASPQEATLLSALPDILTISYSQQEHFERLLPLSLPVAVQASIGAYAPLVAHRHAEVPSTSAITHARRALRRAIGDSEYADEIVRAAGRLADIAVFVHLLSADTQAVADYLAAADTYSDEAAKYPETVGLAYEAAANAAAGEIGDDDAADVAYDAAIGILESAYDTLKSAHAALVDAGDTLREALPEETRAAIDATADEGAAAVRAAQESARRFVGDVDEETHNRALGAVEASIDAAKTAADETLAEDAPEAAAEALRASRGAGLATTVAAEAVLIRFEMGHFAHIDADGYFRIRLDGFAKFLVDSVAVETLLSSNAWSAVQQSLAESCQ